jgi:hypothetical protein
LEPSGSGKKGLVKVERGGEGKRLLVRMKIGRARAVEMATRDRRMGMRVGNGRNGGYA